MEPQNRDQSKLVPTEVERDDVVKQRRQLADGAGCLQDIALTQDMWDYLELEAQRLGITVWQAQQLEVKAALEIDALGISEESLARAVELSRRLPFSPKSR